ncbi:hypothetical protein L195_g026828, partial [Trifolium pratense]
MNGKISAASLWNISNWGVILEIPRYGHSGSSSEDDSHTIVARAGEAST